MFLMMHGCSTVMAIRSGTKYFGAGSLAGSALFIFEVIPERHGAAGKTSEEVKCNESGSYTVDKLQ